MIQNLDSPVLYPGLTTTLFLGAQGTTASNAVTAAGHYTALIFVPIRTMTVRVIGWRPNAVSGSPTAIVGIQGVDASGFPDGVYKGATNNGKVTTGTLTAAWRNDTMGEDVTLIAGTPYAVVWFYNSGTNYSVRIVDNTGILYNFPYRAFNVGTPTLATQLPFMTLSPNGGNAVFSTIGVPYSSGSTVTTFNNTNSAARGNRFQLTVPFRCLGAVVNGGASLGDFALEMYDDAGSVLSSTAYDGDYSVLSVGRKRVLPLTTAVDGLANTFYRMAVVPASATNVDYTLWTANSAAEKCAIGGANFYATSRASGTWTDDTTSNFYMDLILGGFGDDVGGGGGSFWLWNNQ